jgi:hypothetical protein
MTQNHFTISFPIKSPAESATIKQLLPSLMPEFFKAADAISTIHYSRFTFLSADELLFLGDYDGDFGQLMTNLARLSGPAFDKIFQYVLKPPVSPVADNAEAFVSWMQHSKVRALNLYSAYPDMTVKEIKALAASAGVTAGGEQRPFLVVLPAKSIFSYNMIQLLLLARGKGTTKDLDKVGTPHFAQFVALGHSQVGFFTAYDGTFDTYIADFTKNIGEVFDLLFKFTKNAPPSPCRKHLQEFIDFAASANREPIGFYSAYPGLTVQDIHALIADSKAAAS